MGIRKTGVRRERLESLSFQVGVPITEYIGNLPIIKGKRYKTYKQAYQYLYSVLRTQRAKEVKT